MPHAQSIGTHIDNGSTAGADEGVAGLAERQHGVVSRSQLTELGLGRGAINRRIQRRRLHVVHPGVYAVGHRRLTVQGRWMAAVLAAGPGAVLSHRDAAALVGLRPSARRLIEVSAPRRCRRPGIHAHVACLPPDEVTTHDGIPVTTVARTLLDLAAVLPRQQLKRAMEQAEVLRLADDTSVDALLARYPRRSGTAALREIRRAGLTKTVTRSEFEERFLALLDAYDLPRPMVNCVVEGLEVDFHWPEQRLIVELDGRAAHHTTTAFERDRARDRALQTAGWRVVRITWRQLHRESARIAADLLRLLSMPGPHETSSLAVLRA
jgi:predicted transcriptional regulator of viral defense system